MTPEELFRENEHRDRIEKQFEEEKKKHGVLLGPPLMRSIDKSLFMGALTCVALGTSLGTAILLIAWWR